MQTKGVFGPWTQTWSLASTLGPEVTMTLVVSIGHSYQHGPNYSVALKHPHVPCGGPIPSYLHGLK